MRTSAHIFIGGVFAVAALFRRATRVVRRRRRRPGGVSRPGVTRIELTRRCVRRLSRRARPRRGGRACATGRDNAPTRNGRGRRHTNDRRSNLRDWSRDEHHIPGARIPRLPPRARAFSRLPPTDCWRTATPPRSWIATARSAGCACPGTTVRRCSAQILDPAGGHWRIGPTGEYRSERRYLDGTLVIESTFTTETGTVKLTDAMAFADGQRHHELGMGAPHLLLRLRRRRLRRGRARAESSRRRPEYGLVKPLFRQTESGGRTFGGPNQVVFSSGRRLLARGLDDAREVRRQGRRAARVRPAVGLAGRSGARAIREPNGSPSASRTRSPRGARGRPSTTSTRARTASWSGSAPAS